MNRRVFASILQSPQQALLRPPRPSPSRRPVAVASFCFCNYNQSARYLSSDSTTTKAVSSRKRRRSKSLSTTTLPSTTRHRLRQMVELNQLPRRGDADKSIQQLVSVATQRLEWLQTTIYKHWNPDYQPDKPSTSIAAETTTADKAGAAAELARRRRRIKVVMDARWWFWNVMFALFPAAVITVYCEFRVKPAMEEFYARQKQHNNNQHKPQAGSSAQQQDATQGLKLGAIVGDSVEKEQNTSLSERINSFWTEVQSLVLQGISGGQGDEDETRGSEQKKLDQDSVPKVESKADPSVGVSVQQASSGKPMVATESTSPEEPVTLQLLMRRIEQLERKLGQSLPPQTNNALDDVNVQVEANSYPEQSGIRRRIQERMRASGGNMAASQSEESGKDDAKGNEDWARNVFNAVKGFLLGPPIDQNVEQPDPSDKHGGVEKAPKREESSQDDDDADKPSRADFRLVESSVESPDFAKQEPNDSEVDGESDPESKGPWWKFWQRF